MSRSGYSTDLDNWDLIRWRGQVASSIRGKRGQAFLRDLLTALEAMPEKRLIANDLKDESGEVCAIGSLGVARGVDLAYLDPDEPDDVAEAFGITRQLASEIAWNNDECSGQETPEQRYDRMVRWVKSQIREEPVNV